MSSILITGANRGLGFGLVQKLLEHSNPPALIIATYRDRNKSKQLLDLADKNNARLKTLELDTSNFASFPKFADEVAGIVKESGLNVLVNNAGIAKYKSSFLQLSAEDYLDVYKTNVVGPIFLIQALLPLLRIAAEKNPDKQGMHRAAILNVSSFLGSVGGNTNGDHYAYRESKAALNTFCRSLKVELEGTGIIVLPIHPGWVQTDLGGPHAFLTVDVSCSGMCKLIYDLDDSKNVNKAKNITSAKVVDQVKKTVMVGSQQQVKMGHGGTLDETATGVLVVGTGLACKMLPSFLHGSKKYTVRGCLGTETDTSNECGQVVDEKPFDHVHENVIRHRLKLFQGEILQTPPKYSALKIQGQRVADLTRQGIVCDLAPRRVNCYSLRLLQFEPPFFDLEVVCGGGFYVRSLVHDLGKAMGTCAHIAWLHRNRHGFLTDSDALPADSSYEEWVASASRIATKQQFRKMVAHLAARIR